MRCRECSEDVAEMFTAVLMNPEVKVLVVPRAVVEVCLEALDIALEFDQEEEGDCNEH